MERNSWLLACGVVVSVTVIGCDKQRGEPAMTTTTTGALSHDDAIMRLATARCDREAACNEIGAGKKYADRDECTREAGQNARGTLRADQCATIDQAKLSDCLNDIKNERCNNPLDTLDTVTSCTRSKMCVEPK
ncbi:MAG: hypothetical protein BGO98_14555 [Myxococcales bacterium 68-20]|nr:MAG: hypothetical protein BGO98_14555 [Myxococcales bacterium 68-20]